MAKDGNILFVTKDLNDGDSPITSDSKYNESMVSVKVIKRVELLCAQVV